MIKFLNENDKKIKELGEHVSIRTAFYRFIKFYGLPLSIDGEKIDDFETIEKYMERNGICMMLDARKGGKWYTMIDIDLHNHIHIKNR